MTSLGVIGAGVAGLAAAYRLSRSGVAVTVYEAGDRIGGMVRSVRRDGYLAECGPNSLSDPPPSVAGLLAELGLEQRRVEAGPLARNRYVVRGGRLLPLPLSPRELITSPLFSLRAKLGLLREPFVPPADPAAEESVARFVRRRFGREFLDYAAAPFVSGVYAGDAKSLSVRHAFPKLYQLEREHGSVLRGLAARARARGQAPGSAGAPVGRLFSFAEGLEEIPAAFRGTLGGAVRLRAPVRMVRRVPAGWLVVTDQGEAAHDAVVYAAPAHGLARLRVECPGGEDLVDLARIPHPPVSSVVLGFRRGDVEHPLDGFGALVPGAERRRILGVVFSSTLFPGRAPADHVTLTTYVGGARQPELAGVDPETLTAWVRADLRDLLGAHGEPTFIQHTFWPRAIPQYVLGYGRFQWIMDEFERVQPSFLLAGNYRRGISLGDAMASGLDAAERALARLS